MVTQDQVYLSPGVTGMVVDAAKSKTAGKVLPALGLLTGRKREVLQHLLQGETTKEIAHRLRLSVKTVGTPLSSTVLEATSLIQSARSIASPPTAFIISGEQVGACDPPRFK